MERDFCDVITDMDEGKVHHQLTRALHLLAKAVIDTGKNGALTLTIKAKNDGRMVIINADVKTRLPQPATGSTFFFATEDGTLTREDPAQQPLRHLDVKPPTPLKSVKETTTTTNKEGA